MSRLGALTKDLKTVAQYYPNYFCEKRWDLSSFTFLQNTVKKKRTFEGLRSMRTNRPVSFLQHERIHEEPSSFKSMAEEE